MELEIVDALVRCGAFDLVVLESVPGLYSPRGGDQASDGAGESVARARLLTEAMRRLVANIDRTRTVVLFGNRLTDQRADDDDARTTGGRALRFYSSVRVSLQRTSLVQDTTGTAGATIKITVVKNKVAPPLRSAESTLL